MSIQVMLIDKNGVTRMYNSPNPPAPEIQFPVVPVQHDFCTGFTDLIHFPKYSVRVFRRNCTGEPYIYEEV